jgi:hypothetical protein
MKYIKCQKLYFESNNNNRNFDVKFSSFHSVTEKVYRCGNEQTEMFGGGVVFYTSSKDAALTYGKHLTNPSFITKTISFVNPLFVLDGYQLYEVLVDIFGKKEMPDVYRFPYSLNDEHREKIIEYAVRNKYDGIVMGDTDYDFEEVIVSYIEIIK